MNLKKILTIVFVLIALCADFTVSGSNGGSASSNDSKAVLTTVAHGSVRKRMPSRNCLELVYADGIVSLSSDYYEGEFSMTFENLESGVIAEVPSISVGEAAPLELVIGEYEVTALASDGTVLAGLLFVESM